LEENAMNEKQAQPVEIKIHITGHMAVILSAALLSTGLLVYLALGWGRVSAAGPQAPAVGSSGLRQYYLSDTGAYVNGADADTEACAAGYHMASLWEIWDNSNLEYNNALGYDNDDSGQGPPTWESGWVRTGNDSSNSGTAGEGNCLNWSSNSSLDAGTILRLNYDWSFDVEGWLASSMACHVSMRVWCIED
jgi:hypothetical protein